MDKPEQVDKPESDSVLATPQQNRPPHQNGPLRQGPSLRQGAPLQEGVPLHEDGPLQEGVPLQEVGLDVKALRKSARAFRRTEGLQSETTEVPPHRRRWDAFRSKVVSFQFVSGSVLGGTITHLAGSPDAVGPDAAGYLARVGTITGSRLVATGVRHGASAALGLKLKSPEPRGPLGARLKQAAVQELTTRTTSGQRMPAVGEMAGTYGAILTRGRLYHGHWRPGRAATSAAVAIGFKVAWAAGSELAKSLW
ncbi:hypothetical protein GGP55_002681 [Salinibacter ruber]|nr:hypothetical protein [Salinibacter ruber]